MISCTTSEKWLRCLNDCENRDSRNSPSLAVALNCGIGSSSLKCRRERVGKTPNRPWPKFIILRFEVKVMHGPRKVFRSFQPALDKSFVDDNLGSNVREFTSLPGFHLL